MEYPLLFIRPAGDAIDDYDTATLAGFSLLPEVKMAPKLDIDKNKTEDLSDGSQYVASEIIKFDSDSFRCSAQDFAFLRSLHGTRVDVLLMDITVVNSPLRIGYGMRLEVGVLAQNTESAILRLYAQREYPSTENIDHIYSETMKVSNKRGILTGTITDNTGEPVPGATVSSSLAPPTSVTTNALGQYSMILNQGTTNITVSKGGLTFPTTSGVTVEKNWITTLDIMANK